MIFYTSAGIMVGFYIAATLVMDLIQQSKSEGISNVYTNNPVLSVIVNIFAIALIWPIFIPYFFSETFQEAVQTGFNKVINSED